MFKDDPSDKVEKTDKTRQRQGGCQRYSVLTIKSTRQVKYVFYHNSANPAFLLKWCKI